MIKIFLNGIIRENPIMILMIGLCPVLACSASAADALGMGLAASFVLICSNVMVSAIRKIVPSAVRIPVFIVIIATFVTLVDYIMKGYAPALSRSLGVFVPLIVVNCVILGRAEAFAYRNKVLPSLFDGLGQGAGFTVGIVALGIFREILGNGTIFGLKTFAVASPAVIFILPPGAYIGIGILIMVWQYIKKSNDKSCAVSPCANCAMSKICMPDGLQSCAERSAGSLAPKTDTQTMSPTGTNNINSATLPSIKAVQSDTLFPTDDLARLKKNNTSGANKKT